MQELKVVYVDLDGTMLGRNGSLLHDSAGNFSRASIKGLEACSRAGVEVVIKSGRRYQQVQAAARLLGQSSYICEVGALLIAGVVLWFGGDWQTDWTEGYLFWFDQTPYVSTLFLESYLDNGGRLWITNQTTADEGWNDPTADNEENASRDLGRDKGNRSRDDDATLVNQSSHALS